MNDYSIYGLTLRTNRPLPHVGTVVRADAPDIVVELAGTGEQSSMPAVSSPEPSGLPAQRVVDADGAGYLRVSYAGEGRDVLFLLDERGERIWARWNALVGIEDVTTLVTGPMLVCAMRLRGLTCLHGSVIETSGRAFALLGARGTGKTTTALALARRGGRLLSDDVAVIDAAPDGYTVRAGRARLRLRPQPAAALCDDSDALRPLWSQAERHAKQYLDLGDAGSMADGTRVPLAAIYMLGPRAECSRVAIHALPIAAVLPTLMANRHMQRVIDRDTHRRDFAVLARLGQAVPVRLVDRVEGLHHVDAVADAIAADVAQL